MIDQLVSLNNIDSFIKDLRKELESGPMVISAQNPDIGNWGMAKLWRKWMATLAKWMASRGATMPLLTYPDGTTCGTRPFNEHDAHDFFTRYCLKEDATGQRLSWAKNDHDGMRVATSGERFHALRKVELYALEHGVFLENPKDSQYAKLQKEQGE